ncbi:hypothetical protein SAY87_029001 [Trapa incisa]|uniref:Tify domain-containing protein n=1 Tax=Trapa incisa TaxID=236973 RepID=A0AAN7KV28_9MYRT|nr:hypothetical protein SAY87_029001 [Trapa incisa]
MQTPETIFEGEAEFRRRFGKPKGEDGASTPLLETKNLLATMEDRQASGEKHRPDFLANSAEFRSCTFSGSKEIKAGTKVSENSSVLGGEGTVRDGAPAAMTIFYGGEVFVFYDFPPEKLKDVADLAADSKHNIQL